jgi:hypothetical protein
MKHSMPADRWQRSSYCEHMNCVEVCRNPDGVLVRNSTTDTLASIISFPPLAWVRFLTEIKASRFDV